MDAPGNTMDALTSQIVKLRVKGYSFEQISEKIGVDPEEIVLTWREYLKSRTTASPEEEWVLQQLRLEALLVQVNDRLQYADKAEDYELVIKLLDRIAALQGINKDLMKAADEHLVQITQAQTALILQAVFAMSTGLQAHIESAFEKHKTIKAIRGEILGDLTTVFTTEAQRALAGVEE
jgi:hypothetical protein